MASEWLEPLMHAANFSFTQMLGNVKKTQCMPANRLVCNLSLLVVFQEVQENHSALLSGGKGLKHTAVIYTSVPNAKKIGRTERHLNL